MNRLQLLILLAAVAYGGCIDVSRQQPSTAADATGSDVDTPDVSVGLRPPGNAPPSATGVSLTPTIPRTGDTLRCEPTGFVDPDGDPDHSTIAWDIGGVPVGSSSQLTGGFRRGDSVRCVFTPADSWGPGASKQATVLVANTPPQIKQVTLQPAVARVGSPLICTWSGYQDADGDPDASAASWSVNGEVVSQGLTLQGGFAAGDEVVCTVTPSDGIDTGVALSDARVVEGSPPSIVKARIEPAFPRATDTVSCTWTGFEDADGDADKSRVGWTVNGENAGQGLVLPVGVTRDDEIRCTVTPSDGLHDGPSRSATVVVTNAPPSIVAARVTPTDPAPSETLNCGWEGFEDADGDADQTRVSWTVDGQPAGDSRELVAPADPGAVITCTATPWDGLAEGAPESRTLTLGNAAPSVASVAIGPLPVVAGAELVCTWDGFADPEGAEDTSRVSWRVDGEVVGEGPVFAGPWVAGEQVSCRVVPFDGHTEGEAVQAVATVANSAPIVAGVHILPVDAAPGEALRCVWSHFQDADGHPDQSQVAWLNGLVEVATGAELAGGGADGDLITCLVTPFDDLDAGEPASATRRIGSGTPSVASVTITPAAPRAGDTLTCTANGFLDPEGAADASTLSWTIDGVPVASASGPTLDADLVAGQRVTCRVIPSDGESTGTPVAHEVEVQNTPPTVQAVRLEPAVLHGGDVARCLWSGFVDADGDEDLSTVAWLVDGQDAGTGEVLAAEIVRGQEISCVVTPWDGLDAGAPVVAAVLVQNATPEVASVTIAPEAPTTGDTLTCAWEGFHDADGDADASLVEWLIDDEPVGGGPQLQVAAPVGAEVTCRVTPYDGLAPGDAVEGSVVLGNGVPSVGSVTLTPTEVRAGEPLSCSWDGFVDPDGDSDQSLVSWEVAGETVLQGSATLPGSFSRGETVRCVVTPFDGASFGTPVTASVIVSNWAPSIDSVLIGPVSPTATTPLTCQGVGFLDADGDPEKSTYEWWVNGNYGGSAATLKSGFVAGDVVRCRITPSDGFDAGSPQETTTQIANTPPTIAQVAIVPSVVHAGQTVACTWTGFQDVDGHPEQSSVVWMLNGKDVATGLSWQGDFARGDTVGCRVRPFDGIDEGASVKSEVVVQNSPPTKPTPSIAPGPAPADGDDLTCVVEGASTDADGDPIVYTTQWTVDDTPWATDQSTVAAADTSPGQIWRCQIAAWDGLESGPMGEAVVALGTVLSGPINGVEVLDPALSPYVLAADLLIAADATLQLGSGVTLVAGGHHVRLATGARLRMDSSGGAAWAVMDDAIIAPLPGAKGYEIELVRAWIRGGQLHDASDSPRSITLDGVLVEGTTAPLRCGEPTVGCTISGSLFRGAAGLSFGNSQGGEVSIEAVTFIDPTTDYAIERVSGEASTALVRDNHFLSPGRTAIRLPVGSDTTLTASGNWWGTTSAAAIAAMIFDATDSPGVNGTVQWDPPLSQPGSLAPSPESFGP